MLKPVTVSSAAAIVKWNQSIPKYHRYNGTAVRVRTKVPIRNELVIQLIRSVGIRKITGGGFVRSLRVQLACQSLLKRPTENNVFLVPGVDGAAVLTSDLLRFHFGCRPTLFVNCPAGVGQP